MAKLKMTHGSASASNFTHPGTQEVLVRSSSAASSETIRVPSGAIVVARSGTTYSFLNPNTLQKIEVEEAYQNGADLIVRLKDGQEITITQFFAPSQWGAAQPVAQLEQTTIIQSNNDSRQDLAQPYSLYSSGNEANAGVVTQQQPEPQDNFYNYGLAALGGAALALASRGSNRADSVEDENPSAHDDALADRMKKIEDASADVSDAIDEIQKKLNEEDENPSAHDDALADRVEEIEDAIADVSDAITDVQKALDEHEDPASGTGESGNASLIEVMNNLVQMVETLAQRTSASPITINNNNGEANTIGSESTPTVGNPTPGDTIQPTILEIKIAEGMQEVPIGTEFYIYLKFDENIQIQGDLSNISLKLSNGQTATLLEQSAQDTLKFVTTAQIPSASAVTIDQVIVGQSSIEDSTGNHANLNLAGINVTSAPFVDLGIEKIETTLPVNGTINFDDVGTTYDIELFFKVPVLVDEQNAPYLTLNTGNSSIAEYVSGSGTSTLKFKYTVGEDETADPFRLTGLVDNNSIRSLGGTLIDGTTNGLLNSNVQVDTDRPSFESYNILEPFVGDTWMVLSGNNQTGSEIVVRAEDGGQIGTAKVSGTNWTFVTNETTQKLKVIEKPTFDSEQEVFPTRETEYVEFSAKIELKTSEDIQWSNMSESRPYLELHGAVDDLYTENSAKVELEDGLNYSEFRNNFNFILDGFVEKQALDNNEVTPSIFFPTNWVAKDGADNSLEPMKHNIEPGAGRFLEGTYSFKYADEGIEIENFDHTDLKVVSLVDLNGDLANYLDEATGQMIDASVAFGDSPLRTITGPGIAFTQPVATPITEWAIRMVERLGFTPLSDEALDFYEDFARRFELNDIFNEELVFTNEQSFGSHNLSTSQYNYGVLLSSMSSLDAVTGSASSTIDFLVDITTEPKLLSDERNQEILENAILVTKKSSFFNDEFARNSVIDQLKEFASGSDLTQENNEIKLAEASNEQLTDIILEDDCYDYDFEMFVDGEEIDASHYTESEQPLLIPKYEQNEDKISDQKDFYNHNQLVEIIPIYNHEES